MYERSAIVLERYFENLLEYRRECNLRDNYKNYCELVEKLEKYQVNYEKEFSATQDFSESVKAVKLIQEEQEKLYKRSVKLEYNRNLLFNNVDAKVDEIRRCIEKVEVDVEKNNEVMKEIKEKLIVALTDYNDKRFELSKCKRYKKMAENTYSDIIETTRSNFEGITQENIDDVRNFADYSNIEDIIEILERNGKDERIPFNEGVITNATKFGLQIAKKEAAGYLTVYEKMEQLLNDIDSGTTKIDDYKKTLIEEKAKMDFLYAAKEYIFQFLDYERMTIIHGRKSHNRLMTEACENFNQDIIQINNLYELLEREIVNKATPSAYKELYNKSYLRNIQEKEEKFKKEKNKVNLNTATLLNTNYWRIDGIKAIYNVFYTNVKDVLGKNVEEFDLPDENYDDYDSDDTDELIDDEEEDLVVKAKKTMEKKEEKPKTPKIPFAVDSTIESILSGEDDDDEIIEPEFDEEEKPKVKAKNPFNFNFDDNEDDLEDVEDIELDDLDIEDEEMDEEYEPQKSSDIDMNSFDIFGEKYKDIDFSESNFRAMNDSKDVEKIEKEEKPMYTPSNITSITDTENFDDDESDEDEYEEIEVEVEDEEDLELEEEYDEEEELYNALRGDEDDFSDFNAISAKKRKNEIEDILAERPIPLKKKMVKKNKNKIDDIW